MALSKSSNSSAGQLAKFNKQIIFLKRLLSMLISFKIIKLNKRPWFDAISRIPMAFSKRLIAGTIFLRAWSQSGAPVFLWVCRGLSLHSSFQNSVSRHSRKRKDLRCRFCLHFFCELARVKSRISWEHSKKSARLHALANPKDPSRLVVHYLLSNSKNNNKNSKTANNKRNINDKGAWKKRWGVAKTLFLHL